MAEPNTPPPLVRTRDGEMIHRADCRHAENGEPWEWASVTDIADVAREVEDRNYETCSHCEPFA